MPYKNSETSMPRLRASRAGTRVSLGRKISVRGVPGSTRAGVVTLLMALCAACSSGQSPAGAPPGTAGGANSAAGSAGASGTQPVSNAGSGGERAGAGGTNGGGATNTGGVSGAAGGAANGGAGGGSDVLEKGTLYVAPNGDDANPGTMARPLHTIAHARDLVRAMTATMTADIHVYLREGTYPLSEALTFSNADSGKNGFSVIYAAFTGEHPLITGGKAISGWKLSDTANNIYTVSGVMTPFRQLYVNGVKAVRARSPNLGTGGTPNFIRATGSDGGAKTFQVPSADVSNWNNLTKVEMHLMVLWADNIMRIASINSSGGTANVKIQSPEDMIFGRPNPAFFPSQMRFYFENALEFLDQPGEWYLDETSHVLSYKPRAGEDMTQATVVAPMLETVMSIKGTSTADQASYISFQGLTFAHSTYMRPSQFGFLDAQAGQYNLSAPSNNEQTVGRPNAGVSVTNANHIRFERNLFTQMAATGLDFISGTHDDMIIGNAFKDIGGSAISIAKFTPDEMTEYHVAYNPTDKNEICTHDTIKNNYIEHATTEIQGSIGIAAGYAANVDIEHNEVGHVNYSGISVGYGWTTASSAMTNNKINYNNIHHVCEILADCGSIYTLSNQGPASEMLNNYCHDFKQSDWADYSINNLYMDEGTDGYTVAHNVLVNSPNIVHQNKNGSHMTIMDNGPSPTMAQETIMAAGIEPAYADINKLTIPAAKF